MDEGARLNATTWFDRTNYFETVPTGALELALWLEADRHGHLLDAVTQENLDNQRDVVKEEKRQRYDNVPYGSALIDIYATVFPEDHPYHHPTIGSMEDLDAATLEDVHAFFRSHYGPNNTVLTLVGDLTPDEGFAAAEKYFGPLPSIELAVPTAAPAAAAHRGPAAGRPRRRRAQRPPLRRLPSARRHDARLPRLPGGRRRAGWPVEQPAHAPPRAHRRDRRGRRRLDDGPRRRGGARRLHRGRVGRRRRRRGRAGALRGDRALRGRGARRGRARVGHRRHRAIVARARWRASRRGPTTSATTPC